MKGRHLPSKLSNNFAVRWESPPTLNHICGSMWCLLFLLGLASAAPADKDADQMWYSDCGRSKYPDAGVEPFIVGGRDARPYEFPFIVSLRRLGIAGTPPARHFCGGFLVHPEWVMTAAHCMEGEEVHRMVFVLGEHQTNVSSSVRKEVRITDYFMHELYNRPGNTQYDHDIAMVKLAEKVEFNADIQPICQPKADNDYVGAIGSVMGWGTLRSGTRLFPYVLQWTNVPVIPNDACNAVLGGITDNMLCAGRIPEYERDTCQGDSGGPLAVKVDGRFVVAGITSWGKGCATGTPGAYARVSQYIQWAQDKINKN